MHPSLCRCQGWALSGPLLFWRHRGRIHFGSENSGRTAGGLIGTVCFQAPVSLIQVPVLGLEMSLKLSKVSHTILFEESSCFDSSTVS